MPPSPPTRDPATPADVVMPTTTSAKETTP